MPMIGQVELRKQIAARLKKAREAAGYETPEAFCSEFSLDIKKYMKHETGASGIKPSQAAVYGRFLNISLFELMLGDEKK